MNSKLDIAKKIFTLLDDKKAHDIVVIDVSGITTVADFFIIATGTSSTHINALCDHIEKELAKARLVPTHKEGRAKGEWVLMDYQDFVIHIFNAEMRAYYSLERMWRDGKILEF